MHLALVNDVRTPPSPKMVGTCPICGDPVLAKCGTMRVHHWAHRGTRACDAWWERELQWHRDWKNQFPIAWQESIRRAHDGQKHVADVRTEAGLVLEFQHSAIHPSERTAREAFYGNMVWVVDGTRLVRDRPRFIENKGLLVWTGKPGLFTTRVPEKLFQRNWIGSTAQVFFDFGSLGGQPDYLWCLLPDRSEGDAIVAAVSRSSFVKRATESTQVLAADKIELMVREARLEQLKEDLKQLAALRQNYRLAAMREAALHLSQGQSYRRRRRF